MKPLIRKLVSFLALFVLLATAQLASAFYDPSLGRWLNRDPVGDQMLLNLFRSNKGPREAKLLEAAALENTFHYAYNAPTFNIDPLGLCPPLAGTPKPQRDDDWVLCCMLFCDKICATAPSPKGCATACYDSCGDHDLPNIGCLGKK